MSFITEGIHTCCTTAELLVPPGLIRFWEEKAKAYGPGFSGALFGAGWWFYVDAVTNSTTTIPFIQFLPGIIATLALIMINCIRRDELHEGYDAYDDGVFCRARSWLFVSYCVSFGAIVGAVWVLLSDYALKEDVQTVWPGVAGLFQVSLVLGSALLFFVSRTPSEDSGYSQW